MFLEQDILGCVQNVHSVAGVVDNFRTFIGCESSMQTTKIPVDACEIIDELKAKKVTWRDSLVQKSAPSHYVWCETGTNKLVALSFAWSYDNNSFVAGAYMVSEHGAVAIIGSKNACDIITKSGHFQACGGEVTLPCKHMMLENPCACAAAILDALRRTSSPDPTFEELTQHYLRLCDTYEHLLSSIRRFMGCTREVQAYSVPEKASPILRKLWPTRDGNLLYNGDEVVAITFHTQVAHGIIFKCGIAFVTDKQTCDIIEDDCHFRSANPQLIVNCIEMTFDKDVCSGALEILSSAKKLC